MPSHQNIIKKIKPASSKPAPTESELKIKDEKIDTLHWNATPSEASAWIKEWKSWFTSQFNENRAYLNLLKCRIKRKLDKTWRRELLGLDWDSVSIEGIEEAMNKSLQIRFPHLKRAMGLFKMGKKAKGESHSQVLSRVEEAMEHAGMGTRDAFTLDYDQVVTYMTLNSLPSKSQEEIINKYG